MIDIVGLLMDVFIVVILTGCTTFVVGGVLLFVKHCIEELL